MDKIISIQGNDLASLVDYLENLTSGRVPVTQLRVTVDGNQLKLKANGSTWTPGYGELDPDCQAARREDRAPMDVFQAYPSRRGGRAL